MDRVAGSGLWMGFSGPTNYIIGIECDGAGYHSSKSSRDRDRIRQEILESMGWSIYRIWSTDWFKHRKEEELRLQNALAKAKNRAVIVEQELIEHSHKDIVVENDRGAAIKSEIGESNVPSNDSDLIEAALVKFREEIIAKKYPINSRSILSDRMVELFAKYKPMTMEEFRIQVPQYLREKIDRN